MGKYFILESDDSLQAFCYGTANLDIRSFALNFEVNVTVYDRAKAQEMEKIFRADMEKCSRISRESLTEKPFPVKCREQICRLLSPLVVKSGTLW